MTKEQWIRHMESVSGLKRPSAEDGAMYQDWKSAYNRHKEECPKCPECKARKTTRRRNTLARERHQIMVDCGLKRVTGMLGGIYYE